MALLKCRIGKFLAMFAIKCSSWTPVNAGTSGRSACASVGNTDQPSVDESNKLTARTLEFENPFELHVSIYMNDIVTVFEVYYIYMPSNFNTCPHFPLL